MLSPPATRNGFVHAVGFYGSDEEFVRRFAPFCEDAISRGAPTVVRLTDEKAELLHDALGDLDGLAVLPAGDQGPNAPGALRSVLDLCRWYRPEPARPLHLLGELPPLVGLFRDAWLRYEAAVNRVLRGLPVLAICPCDTRVASDGVRAELLRTHNAVVTANGGHEANASYEEPEAFVAGRVQAVRDPLEDGTPRLERVDPSPSEARRAVGVLGKDLGLEAETVHDLLVCVSEVLANATLHGRRPILLRGWGIPGRLVVAVRDAGSGPGDPLAGLLPAQTGRQEGGLGLWITHQLCPETAMARDGGFTVRLAAGAA